MTRIAAALALAGCVIVALGVGFYDWRAGVVVFGVACVVVGVLAIEE